jgi:alpha-amylase/alpha-mannosidase (GH57 family)
LTTSQGRLADVALLFHMHQPDYVDPATGRAELPWVRLHGARGYYDLASILLEYERVHLTVNFVPSLLRQLEEVVSGAGDRWLAVASKHERDWTPADRLFLVERQFSLNWSRCIDPRPRYRELLDRRGRGTPARELAGRVGQFSNEDLRDLTVLFQLAWIGFAARRDDAELARLERKGRGYDLDDLALVIDRQRRACAAVVPLWKKLAARGQVELATSPTFHPIVPLVCDSDAVARARPDLPRPTRYLWPDDARRQITEGLASHTSRFGVAPQGMWPPEGSISPEAVALYQQAGLRWLATDEGNLWNSRGASGFGNERGELYRPHRYGGVDLVFRDRELSDRIGFAYMHGDPQAGADDLLGRARDAAQHSAAAIGDPALVGVFLDGENPWESYAGSGEPFLRALFDRLTRGDCVRAVTISEHLQATTARGELRALHSGSWINSDFHIWIGDPVKNRAWELLGAARRRIEERRAQGAVDEAELALQRILAAEGSDWFWWFGAPYSSAEDPIFDRLFRAHLEAVYRALGDPPPPELSRPVDGALASASANEIVHPITLSRPAIGDEEGPRGYFAWAGAGTLEISRGAAMATDPLLSRVRFGLDRQRLSLRLEPSPSRAEVVAGATVELELQTGVRRFRVRLAKAPRYTLDEADGEAWRSCGEDGPAAHGATIDLGVPWARVGAAPGAPIALVVRLVRGALVLGRYPGEGAIDLKVPDDDFEADHWSV